MVKYKIRRSDGLFYNPGKPGVRYHRFGKEFIEKNFDKTGKLYSKIGMARRAIEDIALPVNKSWAGEFCQTPYNCDLIEVTFIQHCRVIK